MSRRKARTAKSRHARSERILSPDRPAPTPSLYSSFSRHAFLLVLGLGTLLRLIVFLHMGYLNNDNHLEVIEYVAEHWTPARADQFNQAYHPPLYYFVAAGFFRLGGPRAVHGLSLVLSITTLLLMADLLRRLPWITPKVRPWGLALAAFQPQFIMFSLFISNDILAIFLGALTFYQCWRVQEMPSRSNYLLLGTWLGLGLLTKGTFLVFVGPLILLAWMTGRQQLLPKRQLISGLLLFFLMTGVLGCYKYAENFALFGNPMISNVDLWDWTNNQQPTWVGFRSLFDMNLLKLMRYPVISTATVHSYLLMIYGSFWYSFMPESSFHGNLVPPFYRLGSMIYLVALCPTILMLVGATRIAATVLGFGHSALPGPAVYARRRLVYEGNLILVLFLNFLIILALGWHYDIWSLFQGRLLFPSYFALLLAFDAGMEWAESSRLKTAIIRCLMLVLFVLFFAYFIVEVGLASFYPGDPLRTDHMPYTIDMNAR
jgi:4-amino-4-deoxy-L-arabinose transferase-like glycosyltransferase